MLTALLHTGARVLQIPIDEIEPSPWQARTSFPEGELAALAVSILQNGLLQPISVRRVGKRYQLIAGERRLRACRMANLKKVPAILVSYDDSQSAAMGLLENLQRENLDPFDTARGLREVIRLWGCSQSDAAKRLGLSQPALANKLRLLSLTEEQEKICLEGRLTERHARAVLRLPEEQRTEVLCRIAEGQWSVRQAERFVENLLAERHDRRRIHMVRDVRLFLNTMEHAVGLMVEGGVNATATRRDGDGFIEYTVHIPVGEKAHKENVPCGTTEN